MPINLSIDKKYITEVPYTKNEKRHPQDGRYFPLTKAIIELLESIKKMQIDNGIDTNYIFSKIDGTPITSNAISTHLRRTCKRLGITITRNHAFRMSLNSNVLIANDIKVTERAALLGHSVETNQRHYSYMRSEQLDSIRDKLEQNNQQKNGQAGSGNNIVQFRQKKSLQAATYKDLVNYSTKR